MDCISSNIHSIKRFIKIINFESIDEKKRKKDVILKILICNLLDTSRLIFFKEIKIFKIEIVDFYFCTYPFNTKKIRPSCT